MKYYSLVLLIIFLAIIGFIFTPRYADNIWKNELYRNFDKYKSTYELINETFTQETMQNNPESVKKFDFDKFNLLGNRMNYSSKEMINLIKSDYGFYWIKAAYSKANNFLIEQYARFSLTHKSKIFFFITLIIFITINLLFIFFIINSQKTTYKEDANQTFPVLFSVFILIASIIAFILNYPPFIKYIHNPFKTDLTFINYDYLFYFAFITILFQVAFLLFVGIKFLTTDRHNPKYAFLWLVPAFLILINLYKTPSTIKKYYNYFNKTDYKYQTSQINNLQTYMITSIKWNLKKNNIKDLSEFDFSRYHFPAKSEYANYNLQVKDSKLIITSTSFKKLNNKNFQFKIIYDILTDSLRTETNHI